MKVLIVMLALVMTASAVSAQVGTEPLAWAPEHRALADGLGAAAVAAQAAGATWYSVKAWRAGDHAPAYRNLCAALLTEASVESLKRVIHETRPDGSDNLSNPSGHSGMLAALSGWSFSVSIPITVFGALSRADANKHHLWGPRGAKDIPIGLAIGAGAQAACHAFIHQRPS